MNWKDFAVYVIFIIILTGVARPLGAYMATVFRFERSFLDTVLVPLERLLLQLIGPSAQRSMQWREYFLSFLAFGIAGAALIFVLLKLQHWLPWYRSLGADVLSTPMTNDLAINTAVSFATTTT